MSWDKVLDGKTTPAELEHLIDEHVTSALVDALAQIETLGLSPGDVKAALALVAPIVRARTAAALTSGWQRLRDEASQDRGAVH